MPKAKTNPENKIIEAALQLAARQDWSKLTLDHIAKAAKLSPAVVKKHFHGKNALLPAVVRWVNRETLATIDKLDLKASPHDRLFEVMMARLDVLQSHRRAILGIIAGSRRDPSALQYLLPVQTEAMRLMLNAARLQQKGLREIFSVTGLLGVYILTLCVWRTDNSPDMSKTMAVLDRYLRRAGALTEILFRTLP